MKDGINPDEFTLHYITVDQLIPILSQFGQEALMAKFATLLFTLQTAFSWV